MKKIMITLAVCAAFAIPAAANVTNYQTFTDLDYTCMAYGEWVYNPLNGLPFDIVHNGPAFASGSPPGPGGNRIETELFDSHPAYTIAGKIALWGQDGELDESGNDYPPISCGTAAGFIIGSFVPSGYPEGTPIFLNLSVTPNGSPVGDYENFYFKVLDENGLLTNLGSQNMVDSVSVISGNRVSFEMFAREHDQHPDPWPWAATGYDREFLFTITTGGPASVVPVPGSLILSSIGIAAVGWLKRRKISAIS